MFCWFDPHSWFDCFQILFIPLFFDRLNLLKQNVAFPSMDGFSISLHLVLLNFLSALRFLLFRLGSVLVHTY